MISFPLPLSKLLSTDLSSRSQLPIVAGVEGFVVVGEFVGDRDGPGPGPGVVS